MKIEQISQEEGLSHRWVNQITQDDLGFLWISTADGLNRYDGYEFKLYPIEGLPIPFQNTRSIQQASDGLLWITSNQNEHTILFNPHTAEYRMMDIGSDFFEPYPNNHSKEEVIYRPLEKYQPQIQKIEQSYVWPIIDDPRPSKVLDRGTKTYGTESLFLKQGEEAFWVWHNLETKKSTVKVFDFHYSRYDYKQEKWTFFKVDQLMNIQFANEGLPIDTKGRLWYPSFGIQDSVSFEYIQLPESIPLNEWHGIRLDNRLNIWIYDKEHQLFYADLTSKTVEFIAQMPSERIEVFEDKAGTLWVGTENGLYKIRRRKQLFENYFDKPFDLGENPPIGNSMSYIIELGDNQIFTNIGYSKLFQIDRNTQQISTCPFPFINYPVSVSPNYFLVNLDKNVMEKYHIKSRKIEQLAAPEERSKFDGVLEHKIPFELNGNDGFVFYDTLKNRIEWPEDTFTLKLKVSFWDSERQLFWTNYGNEILKIDLKDLSKTFFDIFPGKNDRSVRGWLPEGDSIWLATIMGLKLMDIHTGQVLRSYTTEEGLPHNTIYSIVKSGENLWLGTHTGLCCFNPKSLEVRNFYIEDGLSHNEFNTQSALLASDGRIWMGGLNGLNIFDPKELEKIPVDSSIIRLTHFREYDPKKDTLISEDNIQLLKDQYFNINPNIQSFSFQFIIDNIVNPEKNQYSWYLEGYEGAWVNVSSQPIANYQNVAPGDYQLKVRALDYRGNPAKNELIIPVQVLQVWYKRWWAWLGYFVVISIASYSFYRFQLTRKLAQRERDRLKELDAVKNKLYTNITHEFRTPLTVILGISEQLNQAFSKGEDSQQFEGKVQTIRRNGQNLLNLVNQMLDLSKLESGEMQLNVIHTDIVAYIKYIVESFHSLAENKQIELQFSSESENLEMDFDREKILQIVSNLLSNALKFTEQNGTVNIHLKQRNTPTAQLQLKISDSGIGIEEHKLPYIFDRFYQADNSTTRKGEGTGIGLALVKELVQLMEGKIEVKSEIGKGTEFSILLPIRKELRGEKIASSVYRTPLSPISTDAPNSLSLPVNTEPLPHLLIVEDNYDVAQYIFSCLENDFQIEFAENGKIGIEKAIENTPDIIISDVMMPEKDGFEVVQTLKNDQRTSHIPIILLTAKADISSKLEGLERGADAYLAKPFNREELSIRLKKLIEIRQKLQERYGQIGEGTTIKETKDKNLIIEDAFIIQVRQLIESNISDTEFGVPQLSKAMGMSRSQLFRKLKALTGKSIALYIRSVRLQKAHQLIESTQLNISEIAYDVGFKDPAYFSRTFMEEFGKQPNSLRDSSDL